MTLSFAYLSLYIYIIDRDSARARGLCTGVDLEVQEQMPLLEWFANEYKKFGCTLEFVTNKSQEGSQFCKGFGGIGGLLRYQVDMRQFDEFEEVDVDDDDFW